MTHVRRIGLKNLYNFRDLGGYSGCRGRITAWNRLYRSDCPSALSRDEWQAFDELGIRTLIDLRSTFEASENPVNVPDGYQYLDCHFFYEEEGADLKGEAGKKFMESLSLDYRVMTESSIARIACILTTISRSLEKGNTVFFCTAGKDRTGIIAAEILRMCGVCDEDIIADYAVTEIYNEEVIRFRIASIPKEILENVSVETMAKAASSKPETMREYLAWSKGFHFAERAAAHGFSFEMQEKMREQLLDA